MAHMPVRVVGAVPTTSSGTFLEISSLAAVKNVIIVNDSPIPVQLEPAGAISGTWNFVDSLTVSGAPVSTGDSLGQTLSVTMAAQTPASSSWSNMPTILSSLFNNFLSVQQVDLTHYRQARLVAVRTTAVTTAAPASYMFIGSSATGSLTTADYTSIDGAPHGTKVLISGTASNFLTSAWADILPAKKADMFINVVGSGGDGSLDPAFGLIACQFRT